MPVRGRDDHGPSVEQGAKQSFEDHRIGDVVDLELVEAQQRGFGGERAGDAQDRLPRPRAALQLDPVMDLEHKGMEMHAALFRDRRGAKEQIHQHRFAAPDRSPQIDPPRRLNSIAEPEPGEPAAPNRRHVIGERPI